MKKDISDGKLLNDDEEHEATERSKTVHRQATNYHQARKVR
jgi:hypothetical protein